MINQDYYATHPHCLRCPHLAHPTEPNESPECSYSLYVKYQEDGSCFSKAEKIAEIQNDEEWARSRECYEYEEDDSE